MEKVPPGFLALKGQKQTGSWQSSNSLGSGYRQREEGRQDRGREAGKKVDCQERKEKKKKKAEKSAVWDIFKARTDNSTC